jgi:hypothetical protein
MHRAAGGQRARFDGPSIAVASESRARADCGSLAVLADMVCLTVNVVLARHTVLGIDHFWLFLGGAHFPQQVGEMFGGDGRHLPDWMACGLALL